MLLQIKEEIAPTLPPNTVGGGTSKYGSIHLHGYCFLLGCYLFVYLVEHPQKGCSIVTLAGDLYTAIVS